jgi:hypothetical protein
VPFGPTWSRGSSVSIQAGREVRFLAGAVMGFFFVFATASTLALGPTVSYPMDTGGGVSYPGVKRPEREADLSPPSAEVNNI